MNIAKKVLVFVLTSFILIVAAIYILIFALMWKYKLGVSDWMVDINNYYHVSSNAGIVDVLYFDRTQEYPVIKIAIPDNVKAYSVSDSFLFVNRNLPNTADESAEAYYIVDIIRDTIDGPLTQKDFDDELQLLGISVSGIKWILTSSKPGDAHY